MKTASKQKLINCLKNSIGTWNRYRRFTKYARVDLQFADLQYADLQYADLWDANLRGANIDYTSVPFKCSSIGVKCNERLIRQSLYHVAQYEYIGNDTDIKELLSSDLYKKVANKFHRVKECGEL